MKVAIVYTPDPVYLGRFIHRILCEYHEEHEFVGIIATNSSMTKKKKWSEELNYICALFLILGPIEFIRNIFLVFRQKLRSKSPVQDFCENNNIPFHKVSTINGKACKGILQRAKPDVIFNQSQHIVKKRILDIPTIGTLNRHGAMLPKYRGRLAPFWQLMNGEEHGGVTFHLLNVKIDDGPIVFQKEIPIEKGDGFNDLVKKMFDNAVAYFGTALLTLEQWSNQEVSLKENKKGDSSYFSSPSLKDAVQYRINKLKR